MPYAPINERVDTRGRKRRIFFGFGALLILALLFAAVFTNGLRAAQQRRIAEQWQVHTLEVLLTVEAIKSAVNGGMRGERGYLITGDPEFLDPYSAGRRDAPGLIAKLEHQTSDNPRQRPHTMALRVHSERMFRALDQAVALKRTGRDADAVDLVRRKVARNEIENAFTRLGAIEREEHRLLNERQAADALAEDRIEGSNRALAAVGLLLLCIAGAAGASALKSQRRVHEAAERLRQSATTDELTQLPNRRSFLSSLEIEVARAERNGAPLSIAIIDLDHFKRVNDSYGHAGGDAVLRGFAELAKNTMRTGDIVARIGGEEFAVLMPATNEAEAQRGCERLRALVAKARFATPDGKRIGVTMSSGIALLVAGEERDRLVTRADDALYKAKESGRNQVLLAA